MATAVFDLKNTCTYNSNDRVYFQTILNVICHVHGLRILRPPQYIDM